MADAETRDVFSRLSRYEAHIQRSSSRRSKSLGGFSQRAMACIQTLLRLS
jgi:hypothetical protein